jgi:hypothetical protein
MEFLLAAIIVKAASWSVKRAFRSRFPSNLRLSPMASFHKVYTSLLLVNAGSMDRELARQVNYLKAENQILRSRLPSRISLTEREKNCLIRFADNLGAALNELASIVHPGTICSTTTESTPSCSWMHLKREKNLNPTNSNQISEHGRLC